MPSSPDDSAPKSHPAALSRQPTFLARYQRKFKVSCVSLVIGVFLLGPPLVRAVSSVFIHAQSKNTIEIKSADRLADDGQAPIVGDTAETPLPVSSSSLSDVNATVLNVQDDHSIKLVQAPIPGLAEDSHEGIAPRIGEDGRMPWQAYARPFNTADQRPRISIVIMNVGLARLPSDEAINRLPPEITLAIDVQSPTAGAWCERARQDGHETVLSLPMEPFDYPRSDPGSHTLLTSLSTSDNLIRLLWALRQATGYIGVTSFSGSRFSTDPEKLTPMLQELQRRGLMILDAHVAPHSTISDLAHGMQMPVAVNTMVIDHDPSPAAIDAVLTQLEQNARLNGSAVALASPLPTTLNRLDLWLKDLPKRGIALAPLSAMVK